MDFWRQWLNKAGSLTMHSAFVRSGILWGPFPLAVATVLIAILFIVSLLFFGRKETTWRPSLNTTLRAFATTTAVTMASLAVVFCYEAILYAPDAVVADAIVKAVAQAARPLPPKPVGLGWICDMATLPKTIQPHEKIWLLPLSMDSMPANPLFSSGFDERFNWREQSQPFPWPTEVRSVTARRSLSLPFDTYKCEIRDLSRVPFSNVQIIFQIMFTNGGKCYRSYQVAIPEITDSQPFVFYPVSHSKAFVILNFPNTASLELPDTTQQLVELRKLGTIATAGPAIAFAGTNIYWGFKPPEPADACEKSQEQPHMH